MYYYEMRVVLNEFQKGYALTDGELCACLYDYGARVLLDAKEPVESELPEPINV